MRGYGALQAVRGVLPVLAVLVLSVIISMTSWSEASSDTDVIRAKRSASGAPLSSADASPAAGTSSGQFGNRPGRRNRPRVGQQRLDDALPVISRTITRSVIFFAQ